jgi:hypothetical protein
MLRIVAVAVALPTMFAAWAGSQIATAQPAGQTPPGEHVVLAGCVGRQTGGGITHTASTDSRLKEVLVLTRVVRPQGNPGRGAVPGTPASDGNTGTVGVPPPGSTPVAEQTYALDGAVAMELRDHIGKRIEVTGTLTPLAAAVTNTADTSSGASSQTSSHTSSPRGLIAVGSYRPIGGACPIG